jgi:hypothetical protein
MFWGEGLFVFPLMLLYTIISYRCADHEAAASPPYRPYIRVAVSPSTARCCFAERPATNAAMPRHASS